MSEELTAPAPPAEELNLVALTPAEMVPAQAELSDWCGRKIRALNDEIDELEVHQRLAIENGWKTSVVVSSLNRATRRITYYKKMRAALEAGYLLVPNMPIDVLAVRVKRATPPPHETDSRWRTNVARPQSGLPAGEGRYVDDTTFTTSRTVPAKDYQGKEYQKALHSASDYDEVDFPIQMTKPIVLSAAARAMALKVFDQIGRVRTSSGRDPILIGQLLDPRGNGRCASFFIAWWVDTKEL